MAIQTPTYAIRTRSTTVSHLMRSCSDHGAGAGAGVAMVMRGCWKSHGPLAQFELEDESEAGEAASFKGTGPAGAAAADLLVCPVGAEMFACAAHTVEMSPKKSATAKNRCLVDMATL